VKRATPVFRAGFARREITPPVGVDLCGYIARENPSASILDPLYARAVLLETEEGRALFVGIDCVALERSLGEALRDQISRDTGVPAASIVFMCSHTHSGPATIPVIGCGAMDPDYVNGRFFSGVARAAREAADRVEPARARWAQQALPEWHRYRRPQEPGPSDACLIDHRVRALWLEKPSRDPLGCFWTYTAHPTILCTKEISADWVGRAARRIEETTGAIAVYGQGCAGDVGPIQTGDPHDDVGRMGAAVADVVLGLGNSAADIALDRVWGRIGRVDVPFEPPPDREWLLELERQERRKAAECPPGVEHRIAMAMAAWAHHWSHEEAPPSLPVDLQVLRVGPITFAALPFEALSGVGHAVRNRLGEETVVLGYAHACHSYLAPANQYQVGGYEIREAYRYYDLPAPWHAGAAELVAEAVRTLADRKNRLKGEKHVDSAL